jgi:hypothetical protein
MSMVIKDNQERDIIRVNGEKVIVSRYADLNGEYKAFIVTLYSEMTKEDPKKIRDFLDFKSKENQFCP